MCEAPHNFGGAAVTCSCHSGPVWGLCGLEFSQPVPHTPPPGVCGKMPRCHKGAPCRSIREALAGASHDEGGASEGKRLTPCQIMRLHERPTKGGTPGLRRWGASLVVQG